LKDFTHNAIFSSFLYSLLSIAYNSEYTGFPESSVILLSSE